jgi:hypothetical protein
MEKIKSLIAQLKEALSEIEPSALSEVVNEIRDDLYTSTSQRIKDAQGENRRSLCDFLINNGFTSLIDTDEYAWEKIIDEDHNFYCYPGDGPEYSVNLSSSKELIEEYEFEYTPGFPELVSFLNTPIPKKKRFTFTLTGDFYDEDEMRTYISEDGFDMGAVVEVGPRGHRRRVQGKDRV